MRGFDHPMAKLLSRSAEFIGEARCQGRLYLVKHYPGLVLSDDASDVVFGELFRLHTRTNCCASSICTRLRRGVRRADRISAADAAGDARGRSGERGLDVCLQLAGGAPDEDRVGAVSGAIALVAVPRSPVIPEEPRRLRGVSKDRPQALVAHPSRLAAREAASTVEDDGGGFRNSAMLAALLAGYRPLTPASDCGIPESLRRYCSDETLKIQNRNLNS